MCSSAYTPVLEPSRKLLLQNVTLDFKASARHRRAEGEPDSNVETDSDLSAR